VQGRVTTDSWYWASRVISALADASWTTSRYIIERYAFAVQSKTRRVILETDEKIRALAEAGKAEQAERGKAAQSAGDVRPEDPAQPVLEEANGQVARILREEADRVLEEVLEEATACMTNHYDRADA
jgi:dipeptidase